MKNKFGMFLIVFFLLFSTSCSAKEYTPCREALGALTNTEIGLPSGKFYDMHAPEGDSEFLPDSLLCSLFGNGAMPAVRDSWIDGALFLSLGAHPCELAVFLCDSHDAAQDTAKLFCARIDSVKTLKGGDEYASMLDGARVCIIRNYVILIISSDSATAESIARKAIG